LMGQKRYADALEVLNKGEKISALNADLFILRGQIQVVLQNYNQAHQDFSRAIMINPLSKQAYVDKINLFQIQNQPDSMKKYIGLLQQIR